MKNVNYRILAQLVWASDVPPESRLVKQSDGTIIVRFGEKKWPKGVVIACLAIAAGSLLAAVFGSDELEGPPWAGYAVAGLFATAGFLVPFFAPWSYVARFDPISGTWQVKKSFLLLKGSRTGTFSDLVTVDLERIEQLDDLGSFTFVSYLVVAHVRGQTPIPLFYSTIIEEARGEAVFLSGALGKQFLDHSQN